MLAIFKTILFCNFFKYFTFFYCHSSKFLCFSHFIFYFFLGSGLFGTKKPWYPNFIEGDDSDFEPEKKPKRVKIEKDEQK